MGKRFRCVVWVRAAFFVVATFGVSIFTFKITFFQVVPHITDEIQEWIERAATIPVDGKDGPADVCVIELGGTIGNFSFKLVW